MDALTRMLERRLVAVVRSDRPEALVDVAEALLSGGIEVVEITLTVPRALQVLEQVADALGDRVLLGAGTVLDAPTARASLLAGARFLVSPATDLETIALARRYGVPVLPGALTPTEVVRAWQAGADIVKVFPSDLTGPAYLKALRGPLPQVRLMPTGGVTLETAVPFLEAGACALGVGGALVDSETIATRAFGALEVRARQFVEQVARFTREGE